MNETLLPLVTGVLDRLGVRYALIGAAALAVHGVARSTFDLDLLTTGTAALDPSAWAGLAADPRVSVRVRKGEADDPLAGAVRIEADDQRPIDVIVGRWTWQADALAAAGTIQVAGRDLPVVSAADLVLLKLYAGGAQDLWDVEQLLAAGNRTALIAEVEARIDRLPPEAGRSWARLLR